MDDPTAEYSNRILARLRRCADALPQARHRLRALPMTLAARVGGLHVGVVHGHAEALAGWRFAHDALDAPDARPWLEEVRAASGIDVDACTHTCLPAGRNFRLPSGRLTVINIGAAGMPNFRATSFGVITRIGVRPSAQATLCRVARDGVFIEALPVFFDRRHWLREFVEM
ncbi:MAG: hypothetical protein M5U08_08465 [Burkholderiales bacterium]|nr:hypothetical protein [Burkholderiales bacterium]